jgi:hypothetical protein
MQLVDDQQRHTGSEDAQGYRSHDLQSSVSLKAPVESSHHAAEESTYSLRLPTTLHDGRAPAVLVDRFCAHMISHSGHTNRTTEGAHDSIRSSERQRERNKQTWTNILM